GSVTNVVYREPDLRIVSASAPDSVDSSGTFEVDITVINDGNRATRTGRWLDTVYLSRDTTIDSSDKVIGTFERGEILGAGESYDATISARLPDNIGGEFYLIVITNAGYGKWPGDDPTLFPGTIRPVNSPLLNEYRGTARNDMIVPLTVNFVPGPDLVISEISSSDRVFVGREFTVTYTVSNNGQGDVPDRTATWEDQVYLSRDQYLDFQSDQYVENYRREGVLNADGSYTVTLSLDVPRGITGAYYVFVVTDRVRSSIRHRGAVIETSETNNTRATLAPMLIELPPPSDLQVDAVVGPANGTVGDEVFVTITVTNRGTESAIGNWYDAVYLSADGIWDFGDLLLGTISPPVEGRSLAPGQSYTATLTATLPATLPGSYRLLVRADNFNDIYEAARDDNNLGIAADALTVSVPTLTVGVPLTVDLPTRGSILYRVLVPAGETLQVSLDAAGGLNELYLRHEDLPSSTFNDGGFEGALVASPTALVPTTKAGYYYILARAQSGGGEVTLNASFLPFGITSITPDDAGAGRYVTMTIRGARFNENATVKLIRPTFGEFVPVNYEVVDATRIVAVFDLREAPLGLYDVQVANPDGTSQIIPYRFLIEPPKEIDVAIGLGGPDELFLTKSGFDSAFYGVSLQSLTNVDTPYVFIQYGVPRIFNDTLIPGERLNFQTNLQGQPNVSGVNWADLMGDINQDGVITASGFANDFRAGSFGALTFGVELYPGLKELLEANPRFL
ncbi:MAG: hypothetical protein KJT03_17085, partial [Verrucomicrobiae bacterium]|nr:hypothetical protein [Verrucomicrobiae bacterium]